MQTEDAESSAAPDTAWISGSDLGICILDKNISSGFIYTKLGILLTSFQFSQTHWFFREEILK